MKKILTIAAVVALGTVVSYSQGLISINSAVSQVSTNTTAGVSGKATGAGNPFLFEVLYSSDTTLTGSANNILGAINGGSNNIALWTDSTVSGNNGTGLGGGKIVSGSSVAATGWTVPGVVYDNARAVIVVGWSASYGANWTTVASLIQGAGLSAGGFFGTSAVGLSYAGGGSSGLPAVNVFAGGGAGGIIPNTFLLNQVTIIPEPTTMALAGLGGLSLLLFRRRK
jgi:hypothetical protein